MCKLCKIESLLFCLLCFVSIFFYSHHMTDTYIVPKWSFTLLVLLVSIFVLSIKKLCNKTIRIDIVAYGCIIVLITFCQALYGIGQWFQWILSIRHYKIVGSFDNPAGFASCLCIGFPFVALCLKVAKGILLKVFLYLLASIIILAVILSESAVCGNRNIFHFFVSCFSLPCWRCEVGYNIRNDKNAFFNRKGVFAQF